MEKIDTDYKRRIWKIEAKLFNIANRDWAPLRIDVKKRQVRPPGHIMGPKWISVTSELWTKNTHSCKIVEVLAKVWLDIKVILLFRKDLAMFID